MLSLNKSNNKMILISLRIPQTTLYKLDFLSTKLKKDRSDLIRMILDKSLIYIGGNEYENKKTD